MLSSVQLKKRSIQKSKTHSDSVWLKLRGFLERVVELGWWETDRQMEE